MLSALLGFMAVVLTAVAYFSKRITIGIASAFAWGILGLQSYTNSTTTWDVYYCLFWFSIVMMLAIALESIYMKFGIEGKNEVKGMEEEDKEKREEETGDYEHPMDKMRRKQGLPPIHRY